MDRKEELKQILRELNEKGENPELKEKVKRFLKDVDATTLSLAEQELLDEGVSQERLHGLCDIHLEILGGALEAQRPDLEKGHPVCILMDEHQIILANLEELRRIVSEVKTASGFKEISSRLKRLLEIARLLLETESHHQREEQTLFPRLEKQGVTGPPRIMRQEHEELRAKKRRLAELLEKAGAGDFRKFAAELDEVGSYIATTLREHIYKEDNILYPTALQMLETGEWPAVRREFDRIGYCCFTPEASLGKSGAKT